MPEPLRAYLFGLDVELEGPDVDRGIEMRPITRRLLAWLVLASRNDRYETDDLAKIVVLGCSPDDRLSEDALASAQQQLRNAQYDLRKRMGSHHARHLLGYGKHWLALRDVASDVQEFMDAVAGGDGDRARAIAAHGPFLYRIQEPWAVERRQAIDQILGDLPPAIDASLPKCLGLPTGSLEKERQVAFDQRCALGDAPRERVRGAPPDGVDNPISADPERQPGPDGDRRRARRTRRAATLAASVLVLVLVLVLVTLLHKSTSSPRPVKRADATRLVEQYIARFRAEDLRGVIATLAPSPKIIDRTQAALTDETTTTTTGLNEVRGEYRATFAIGDLSDRRERVVDSRVGVAATIVDTKWTDALTRRNIGPRSQGITSYEVVAVDGVPRIATVRERSLVAFPFSP